MAFSDGHDESQAKAIEPGDKPGGKLIATFAAGCFWGVEDFFLHVPGVVDAVSGYTQGQVDRPTYEQVCSGRSGHAEAVLVTYDPSVTAYPTLVAEFFRHHDPTTPNRQGPDVGTQYRSGIYTHSAEQAEQAAASARQYQHMFKRPIVTEIKPAVTFWPAEGYHQRYVQRTGRASCHVANW